MTIDINTEIYRLEEGKKIKVVIASTLNVDGSPCDDVFDATVLDGTRPTLMDDFEYVVYGRVFKYNRPKVRMRMCARAICRVICTFVFPRDWSDWQRLVVNVLSFCCICYSDDSARMSVPFTSALWISGGRRRGWQGRQRRDYRIVRRPFDDAQGTVCIFDVGISLSVSEHSFSHSCTQLPLFSFLFLSGRPSAHQEYLERPEDLLVDSKNGSITIPNSVHELRTN